MAATLTARRRFVPVHRLAHLIATLLLVTLPACSSRPSPPATLSLPSQEIIAGLLQNGKQAVVKGQYDRAIGLFRRIQTGYPHAPEQPEARLLLAQTLEKLGEMLQALIEYRALVSEFPQASQATVARIKIPELERQAPIARPTQESRIIGVLVGPDALAGLDDRELGRLRQAGTNTLFVSVTKNRASGKNGRGAPPTTAETGVYFKTDWAPVIRDALSTVVDRAHRHGMPVWASLSVRRMDWIDPKLEWADWAFHAQTGRLERVETLDVLHPALRDYLVGLLTDLAGAGVDGLFLEADPPSAADEGFSDHALKQFEKDMGRPMDPSRLLAAPGTERSLGYAPELWRWLGWKQREQSKSVLGVLQAVRTAFPGLKTAVEVHAEAVTNPQAALARYAEDLFDLRRYRLDYIAMSVTSSQGTSATGSPGAKAVKPGIKAVEMGAKAVEPGIKAVEIVRRERLLLLVDPADKSGTALTTLPVGVGVLYKEEASPPRLTNQGR